LHCRVATWPPVRGARLHGACIGSGIEFPAFAGRVVAAPDAWFQLPELTFGLIPGAGGCVSISRRIGRQRMARLVLSGNRIMAERALAWGWWMLSKPSDRRRSDRLLPGRRVEQESDGIGPFYARGFCLARWRIAIRTALTLDLQGVNKKGLHFCKPLILLVGCPGLEPGTY
jgi:hypothetical protein